MVQTDEKSWLRDQDEEEDEHVCYLNHASQIPLDPVVSRAGLDAVQRPPWKNSVDEDQAAVRRLFAGLIQAESKDIAIVPSTAFAMSLAAMNLKNRLHVMDDQQRGRIMLLQDQMCSAVYGWQDLCNTSENATLDIVPYPDELGWTQAVLDRLDDSVLVACLPPVHWSDGSTLDLEVIGEKCRRHGVHLIVDATQAVGVMPLDITVIRPTLLAASVHKWLRGPIGASLVYISPSVHDTWKPLDQNHRSRDFVIHNKSTWDASQNEIGPHGYPEKFISDARKFDGGGKANAILLPMIRAGLELVAKLDITSVQCKLKELVQPILEWANHNGFSVSPSQNAYHVIGIRPCTKKKMTPQDMVEVATMLEREMIYIAVRCGAFRISPYIETTPSDITVLLEAFDRYCPS